MKKLLKILKSFMRKFKSVKTSAVLKKDGEICTIDEVKTIIKKSNSNKK